MTDLAPYRRRSVDRYQAGLHAQHANLWLEAERNTQLLLLAREREELAARQRRMLVIMMLVLPAMAGGMALAFFYPLTVPIMLIGVPLGCSIGMAVLVSRTPA